MKRLNLAVFISGRGSNLQSIIDACEQPDFPARIRVVLSNEPDAYGLQRAEQAGIPTEIVAHKSYPSRFEFEQGVEKTISKYPVDLICLAGFMRVLTPDFVARREGRILNIHPSLLPAYPGLHTHERVLSAGEKESGCSVHFVTPGLDEGPVLVQKRVPVETGDTAETLSARVLAQEHLAYPEAIRLVALGQAIYHNKDSVEILPPQSYTPSQNISRPDRALTKETPAVDHHSHADNTPDERAVNDAYAMWGYFTKAATFTVIGVAVILLLMAVTIA